MDLLAIDVTYIPIAALGTLILIVGVATVSILKKPPVLLYPLAGKEYGGYSSRQQAFGGKALAIYTEGYRRFEDAIYRLTTTDGDRLVLPPCYLDEVKQKPDEEISIARALQDVIQYKYTGLNPDSPLMNHVIRSDLTRNLARINGRLCEAVDSTINLELPSHDSWTPVKIYGSLLRIVSIVSGHIFLGPELCRREEYLRASINFTSDLFVAVHSLRQWPEWLRPVIRLCTPEVGKVWDHRSKFKEFLRPIIQERRVAMEQGKDMPDDMLQWILNKSEDWGVKSDGEIADIQLNLGVTAIHTTTQTTTQLIFDLVTTPGIMGDLRNEIRTALEACGGAFTTQALFQLKLMDSALKESMRMNPIALATFERHVIKPTTLKDGTFLPAGSILQAPHGAIIQDERLYPNPDVYDPYRFYKLRTSDIVDPLGYKSKEQYQTIAATKENLSFGYGRHACPGRFYAINEIKLMVSRILLNYDIKMPDGVSTRFANMSLGGFVMPNLMGEVMMRKAQNKTQQLP